MLRTQPCLHSKRLLRAMAVSALVCVAGAVVPELSMADEFFPAMGDVGDLSAAGGYVVWERATPLGERLTQRHKGVTRDLTIRAAANFAGLDVGRDERGHLVALYSRCADRVYTCDVYLYRFATRRETRVRSVSKPRCDETSPSIWNGVIAFSRGRNGDNRRARCFGGLYAKGRGRGARPQRLTRSVPESTDVHGRWVAFTFPLPPNERGSDIRLARLGVKRNRVRKVTELYPDRSFVGPVGCARCDWDSIQLAAAVLDGGYLYWTVEVLGFEFEADAVGAEAVQRVRLTKRGIQTTPPRAVEDGGTFGDYIRFDVKRGTLFQDEDPGLIRRSDKPKFQR